MIDGNFFSNIKNSIKECIKKDVQFKNIPFKDSVYNLSPNSFNHNQPIMVIGLNEIQSIKPSGICGYQVTQTLSIEYHTKSDNKKDWESEIGMINLKIINLIQTELDQDTLFGKDIDLEFTYANTGRFRKEENNKDKILSNAGVIRYNLKYYLEDVIL